MRKVLFIDRDGTILKEPKDEQVDNLDKVAFLKGAISNLSRISKEMDFEFVMVTNQDGLGTSSFPENSFWPIQKHIIRVLESESIFFDQIFIDRSFPEDGQESRKPGTGMLTSYINNPEIDLENSFVIGDRETDIKLAFNLGCKSIFIGHDSKDSATVSLDNWSRIYQFLSSLDRISKVEQKTNETTINVWLNLDGTGQALIHTGIDFFDHMLNQLGTHGGIDLQVTANGDLGVDEHHTIEDTAIALGAAFRTALAKKAGVERFGFLLPMDDCLAQVAIDFGGRSQLVWDVDFKREKIGAMPTEMFEHFFKSFCDSAGCNINVKAEGQNEHHKIESIFKAWSRAIKMAIRKTSSEIPSTKGVL